MTVLFHSSTTKVANILSRKELVIFFHWLWKWALVIIILKPLVLKKFNPKLLSPKSTTTMVEATSFHCCAIVFWLPCWLGLGSPGSKFWERRFVCKRVIEECSEGLALWCGCNKVSANALGNSRNSPSEPSHMEAYVASLISHLIPAVHMEEHSLPMAASFSYELLPERVLPVSCQ